jgi:hypothetical protein
MMDNAVSLVETYLRVNGYFTVTEFPVVELPEGATYRTATDLDVLALRFPSARHLIAGDAAAESALVLDPALGALAADVDMIVGEVKESHAEFNPAGLRPDVLGAVLARFGCCPADRADALVRHLVSEGRAQSHRGHVIRLVAFGGKIGQGHAAWVQVSLAHVIDFLKAYVRRHWSLLRHVQSKDPTLGTLIMMEKLRGGAR